MFKFVNMLLRSDSVKRYIFILLSLIILSTACTRKEEVVEEPGQENIAGLEENPSSEEAKLNLEKDLVAFKQRLESTTWVGQDEVDESGSYLSLRFLDGKVEYGFYRSEVEMVNDYKIQKLEDDQVEIILGGEETAKISLSEGDSKLEIYYVDRNLSMDYISEELWENSGEE